MNYKPVPFAGFEPYAYLLLNGPNYYPKIEHSVLILDFKSVKKKKKRPHKHSLNLLMKVPANVLFSYGILSSVKTTPYIMII